MQSFCFPFISSWILLLTPYSGLDYLFHHHTFITFDWAEGRKNKSRRMRERGKRLHSSSGRLASKLQIYIFPGSMKMAKCPQSFLPAGVWINSLESYSITVNYLCSWEDVHRQQQRWLQIIFTSKSSAQFNKTCYSFKKHKRKCYDAEQKASDYICGNGLL